MPEAFSLSIKPDLPAANTPTRPTLSRKMTKAPKMRAGVDTGPSLRWARSFTIGLQLLVVHPSSQLLLIWPICDYAVRQEGIGSGSCLSCKVSSLRLGVEPGAVVYPYGTPYPGSHYRVSDLPGTIIRGVYNRALLKVVFDKGTCTFRQTSFLRVCVCVQALPFTPINAEEQVQAHVKSAPVVSSRQKHGVLQKLAQPERGRTRHCS
jgi:hypothetical protein